MQHLYFYRTTSINAIVIELMYASSIQWTKQTQLLWQQ